MSRDLARTKDEVHITLIPGEPVDATESVSSEEENNEE